MNKNEWYNLIVLSKSDFRLAGTILTGVVDEYIKTDNLNLIPKFTLTKPVIFNIEFSIDPYHYYSIHEKRKTKLKRGSKIKFKNYKVVKHFPRKRKKLMSDSNVNRYAISDILLSTKGKIITKTPVDGLWELKIPNFRLRFIKYSDLYHCRVQVKYKFSNTKNELFNMAFNSADRYPRKGKYVNFIEFTVDEKPEEMLWYLTKILQK